MSQNPFTSRLPIQPSRFYGRVEDVRRMAKLLAAQDATGYPASIALHGPPKIGKSSLVKFICAIMTGSDLSSIEADKTQSGQTRRRLMAYFNEKLGQIQEYVFVELDCASIIPKNEPEFLRRLIQALRPTEGILPQIQADAADYVTLQTLLDFLKKQGRKIVVFLDEFDMCFDPKTFPDSFFANIFGLVKGHMLALVVVTQTPIRGAANSLGRLGALLHDFPLGPFTEEEARAYICDASARAGVELGPYADSILAVGGLHPCLLTMTCMHAFEYIAAEQTVWQKTSRSIANTASR